MRLVLFSLAVASVCAVEKPSYATVTPGCKNPLLYGAFPNDGIDDRFAFQSAIDDAIAANVDVCTDVTIQDSTIVHTPMRVFHLNNLPHFTMLRSHVIRTASVTTDGQAAIYGSDNQQDMTDVTISNCDFALAESSTLVTLASASGYHAAQAVVEDSRAALITAVGVRYKISLSTGLTPTSTCDGWSGGGCP